MSKREFIIIPMNSILRLAELNGAQASKEKAKQEVSEFLVELCSNKNDEDLLKEAADVFITTLQVLKHKGLLERLPSMIIEKSKKGLGYYNEIVKENLPVLAQE